jgi:thiosulfate/3-mercaptopyruvate sulfurtransferase
MNTDFTNRPLTLSRKIKSLFSLFLLIGFFALNGAISLAKGNFSVISQVEEISKYPKNEIVFLDSRSTFKFLLGHIPGAVHLPNWKDFTETRNGVPGLIIQNLSTLADKISDLGIDKNKKIVIYGDPQDPWRTDGRFLWMFHYLGFENISILEGGAGLWQKKGNKIERGRGSKIIKTKLKESDIQLNSSVIANRNWIGGRLGNSNLSIIDTRTLKEFKGSTPYGSKKGGHIPGAIHIDWRDFFNEEGLLKSRNTLVGTLERYNITANKEVVVYCTGGVRSAMSYFVLKYLGFKTRNYDGSWWDWSSTKLPTEL